MACSGKILETKPQFWISQLMETAAVTARKQHQAPSQACSVQWLAVSLSSPNTGFLHESLPNATCWLEPKFVFQGN